MTEPASLTAARSHLSRAEAGYRTAEGLYHLEEGLALLEQAAAEGTARHRKVAANLLATYGRRICESVRKALAEPALPEPELERLFKVLLAFDGVTLELPAYVRSLKIEIARRLVERYYEGYPAEDKQEALERLAGIAGED